MNTSSNTRPLGRSLWLLAVSLLFALPLMPQDTSASLQPETSTFNGAVVSSTRNTLVVRDDNGRYQLFVFDQGTIKPAALASGNRVRVISTAGDEPDIRVAREITILAAAPKPEPGAAAPSTQPIPPQVRGLERDIERQMRRYQAGFRAGVGLDPEVILVGAHAQLGPFFNSDVFFRPNVEYGFGEVTSLVAFNLEFIYRLPISSRQGRWSAYFGAGPALTLLHRGFKEEFEVEEPIDFGDWDNDIGLNILGGIRYRSGMFMELKGSVYSRPAPVLRFIVGYNF